MMKILCARCGRNMRDKDGDGIGGISHGLCKRCSARLLAKATSADSTGSEHHDGEHQTKPCIAGSYKLEKTRKRS